jgi:hypothetical protein
MVPVFPFRNRAVTMDRHFVPEGHDENDGFGRDHRFWRWLYI